MLALGRRRGFWFTLLRGNAYQRFILINMFLHLLILALARIATLARISRLCGKIKRHSTYEFGLQFMILAVSLRISYEENRLLFDSYLSGDSLQSSALKVGCFSGRIVKPYNVWEALL